MKISQSMKPLHVPPHSSAVLPPLFPLQISKYSLSPQPHPPLLTAQSLPQVSTQKRSHCHSLAQAPVVSSKHWCIYESNSSSFIHGLSEEHPVEIASLTKIMTLYVCLYMARTLHLNCDLYVLISKTAAFTPGTTANLSPNDKVRIRDLFYGLMLPSGNDAATALAEYFGGLLNPASYSPQSLFISEMNQKATCIGMYSTVFGNPHGLVSKRNLSTARDVCKLASLCMKDAEFRTIVNTQQYCCEVINRRGRVRKEAWVNTNLMLSEGFQGVKTGVTSKAGPCLCVNRVLQTGESLVITLLKCKSMESRWKEVKKLADWAARKYLSVHKR